MIDTSQSNGQLYFVQFTLNFSFSASKIQITNEQTQQIRAEGFWRWVCLMLLTAEAFVSWNLKFIFGDGWFMFGQGRGIVGLMWGKWSLLWLWEPRSDVTLPVSPAHEYSALVTSHNNDIMTVSGAPLPQLFLVIRQFSDCIAKISACCCCWCESSSSNQNRELSSLEAECAGTEVGINWMVLYSD